MDHDNGSISSKPPAGWLEALERGRADAAAGRVVDGEVIHRELREAIARMQARQLAKPDGDAVQPR